MTKQEFLETLRQSLAGEVSTDTIEQNIRYYDQYITSKSDETNTINSLGDPRLIAKTIIETDKAARQKGRFTGAKSNYTDYQNQEDENNTKESNRRGFNLFFGDLKWYHKLAIALSIILALVIIVFIGSIILRFLFAFMIPIIIILVLISLFKKR